MRYRLVVWHGMFNTQYRVQRGRMIVAALSDRSRAEQVRNRLNRNP